MYSAHTSANHSLPTVLHLQPNMPSSPPHSPPCRQHAQHTHKSTTGAGNFRRMAGPPVYGVAMCTVQGIRNVLGAVADAQPNGKSKVCVFVRAKSVSSAALV